MRLLIFIFGCLIANLARAASFDLECHLTNSGAELVFEKKSRIFVPDSENCDFTFEAINNIDGMGGVGIVVGPNNHDLGLNAKNSIFLKQKNNDQFIFSGSIPVDAKLISPGKYESIIQEGGGIYLNYYLIMDGRISISSKSKTLLIDGKYCINKNKVENFSNIDSNAKCAKKIHATFKNPICVKTINNADEIVAPSYCSELLGN